VDSRSRGGRRRRGVPLARAPLQWLAVENSGRRNRPALVEWGIERLPIGGRIDSVLVSDSFTVIVLIAGNAWLVWRWRRV
jgi:hypothetical protein